MKTIKFVSEALTLSVLDEQGKAKVGVFPVGTKVVTETLPASFSSLEKKGIKIGTKLRIRSIKCLLSKSEPLAVWAFIIRSVSSANVGINRRAMLIIMATSCTGKCRIFSGDNSASIPSVSITGVVV